MRAMQPLTTRFRSALIAAIVAIVALGIASYTIWSSNRALIRERQLTFELGVLAQLAHASLSKSR